ncbi:hypothetical protein DFJ73DRAFT_5132 [Zopfochytrium polystomum]|nr:hypothetical protein DFJ73DRAFT_5132 [Zopfochytrium polystomum]
MTERVPQIFRFLASFDIVLLQTSTEDLADQRRISETILALLNAEQKAKGSGKISFENRLSSQDGPPNLHIFVKAENSRLRTLACSSQQYAASAFLTGCALIVQNRHPLIVTTLDDAVVPGTPWTNPTQDLPDSDAAAMKRQYGTLCRSFAKQAGVVTTGEDISDWCSRFPVSAVFAGSWGDIVDPAAGKGHLNRTFAEFKSAVEFVEHQILRKNQIGDRGFPKSRNDALRVRVVVPPERAPATEEELMYEGSLTISNVLGWLIGSKESSRALWPYWTNSWGAVSSFLVLWTSTDVPTNTPEIEPDVPMQLARVDEFLRSPVCGNRLLSHSLPGSIDRCSGSLPACSGPGFADVPERFSSGVTALRVDAAERPGSSSSRSLTDRSKASMCAAVSAREMENFKANRVAITITDQWMAHDEL